jgi:AcrR family transcriptional regulator
MSSDTHRKPRKGPREGILSAAFQLVGEVGYSKLTIEAIAARAKVGKQTIYRWWPSKGAVLLDSVLQAAGASAEQPAPLADSGDFVFDLRALMYATVDELNDPGFDAPLRALTIAIAEDPALARSYEELLDRPMRDVKRDRFQSAQAKGQIAADVDIDALIDALFSPIAQRWLLRTGPLTHEYVDALIHAVLQTQQGARS